MTEDLVKRLRAIDEEAMYSQPATTHATINEAADLIESLTTPQAGQAVERVKAAMLPLVSEDMDPAMRDAWLGDLARAALSAAPNAGLIEAGQFLLDRLVDHEVRMTSEDDSREWAGHVTPAMARFRAALDTVRGG